MQAIRLYFSGPLHLSTGKTDNYDRSQPVLHSDTIKSALLVQALQLFGEDILDGGHAFFDKFKITSAFPFYDVDGQAKSLYFFPRPIMPDLPLEVNGRKPEKSAKLIKGIDFMEQGLFEKLLRETASRQSQEQPIKLDENNFSKGKNLVAENVVLKNKHIYKDSTTQHVSIPRFQTMDAEPYYMDKIFFEKGAGLFFLLECEKESETYKQIIAALNLWSDNGIATDRNTGGGQFHFKIDEEFSFGDLGNHADAEKEINLSLYCPKSDEVNDMDGSSYKLTRRGGYISSPQNPAHISIRKRSVYMFEEGSIFPMKVDRNGKVAKLTPDKKILPVKLEHEIYRDGQAIFLPIHV